MAPRSERLAAALAHACQEFGRFEVVNLGSDHPVTLNELIGVLGRALGVEPRVEQFLPQPGDVERTWTEISGARALLGYEPRTPFSEGIRRFVEWLATSPP